MKRCACCKEEKSLESFGVNRQKRDNLHCYCRSCCKKKREPNREKMVEYCRSYNRRHAERLKQARKQYYEANKESLAAAQKRYYEENREAIAEAQKKWSKRNPKKVRAIKSRWKRANPENSKHHCALRRLRLKEQVPEDFDIDAVKAFYRDCPAGMEVDHIIPVSRGGMHHIDNLQYLSKTENRSKGNKILEEHS